MERSGRQPSRLAPQESQNLCQDGERSMKGAAFRLPVVSELLSRNLFQGNLGVAIETGHPQSAGPSSDLNDVPSAARTTPWTFAESGLGTRAQWFGKMPSQQE